MQLPNPKTTQAVALGAVPIVQSSSIDALYRNHNILVVSNLATLDVSLLSTFPERQRRGGTCPSSRHVWAHYWIQELTAKKQAL